MADSLDLGIAFLGTHPAEAARVLESLPTREASELFATIPAPLGAGVLAAMLPTAAARILNDLPEEAAVALAAAAGTQSLVAMLRHVEPVRQTHLLARIPAATAVATRMLLGFPDDTVGAWADTAIVVVAASLTAGAALEQARVIPDTELDRVFVVDAEQHLLGWIGLQALLRADPRTTAGSLARPVSAVLSVVMPMASARLIAAWERVQMLPVLDRDQRLIGVLRRSSLTRSMRARNRGAAHAEHAESVSGALAQSYWNIVSGLSSATLSLLPSVKRVLPEDV